MYLPGGELITSTLLSNVSIVRLNPHRDSVILISMSIVRSGKTNHTVYSIGYTHNTVYSTQYTHNTVYSSEYTHNVMLPSVPENYDDIPGCYLGEVFKVISFPAISTTILTTTSWFRKCRATHPQFCIVRLEVHWRPFVRSTRAGIRLSAWKACSKPAAPIENWIYT